MAKKQTFVGIDLDTSSVRGVRLAVDAAHRDRPDVWHLLAADEMTGDFFDLAQFATALKNLRNALAVGANDKVAISLSGKQTYAAQLNTRKLPDNEMAGMLKLELRKSMPFEASVATFDYQVIDTLENSIDEHEVSLIVGAAANAYLDRQVVAFDKAGLRPYRVDILPISVANVFWSAMDGKVSPQKTYVILHIGTNACTLVIDGGKGQFFNRAFSFNVAEVIRGNSSADLSAIADVKLQTSVLASEITKSVAYYRNTYHCTPESEITILGNNATHEVFDELVSKIGYKIRPVMLPSNLKCDKEPEPGKYDLSIGLAMQLVRQ